MRPPAFCDLSVQTVATRSSSRPRTLGEPRYLFESFWTYTKGSLGRRNIVLRTTRTSGTTTSEGKPFVGVPEEPLYSTHGGHRPGPGEQTGEGF